MISAANAVPLAFVLGMAFIYLLQRFEHQSIKLQKFEKYVEPEISEEDQVTEFIQAMWDVTGDDLRLVRYKPKHVRNAAPRAITATPSRLVDHMSSITTWMDDNQPQRARR